MLPAWARLHHPREFRAVSRRGRRGSSRRLVVHVAATGGQGSARAGFVVSKRVGNAVIRHRVTRRLRALVAARLGGWPDGTDVVIRALPTAASASSAALAGDLDAALALAQSRRR